MNKRYHYKWPLADLQRAGISAEEKAYLSDIGVPIKEDWVFDFHRRMEILPGYVLLGFGSDMPICISPAGRVVALDDRKEAFLNTNPICFAKSIAAYFDYQQQVERCGIDDEDATLKLVASTEDRLREIDPEAFASSDHVWPQMVEQMRDGSA